MIEQSERTLCMHWWMSCISELKGLKRTANWCNFIRIKGQLCPFDQWPEMLDYSFKDYWLLKLHNKRVLTVIYFIFLNCKQKKKGPLYTDLWDCKYRLIHLLHSFSCCSTNAISSLKPYPSTKLTGSKSPVTILIISRLICSTLVSPQNSVVNYYQWWRQHLLFWMFIPRPNQVLTC